MRVIKWANSKYKETDKYLHEAGIGFIRRIYDLHKRSFPAAIEEVKWTKQFNEILNEVLINTFMPLSIGEEEHRIVKKAEKLLSSENTLYLLGLNIWCRV